MDYPANHVRTAGARPDVYFAGLRQGVDTTISTLLDAASACANQRFVLSGYSQGAMMMHRVMHQLEDGGPSYRSVFQRVDAAVLIADGDTVQNDRVTRFGSAPAGARGIGQAWRTQSGATTAKFSQGTGVKVLSVCEENDVVCDFHGWNALSGVSTHSGYKGTPSVLQAAQAAARLIRSRPLITTSSVSGTVGTPLAASLAAEVDNSYSLTWRAKPSTQMPAGIRLRSTGELRGTPTSAGTFALSVQVRPVVLGVAGRWVDGVVSLVVSTATPTPPPVNDPSGSAGPTAGEYTLVGIPAPTGSGQVWTAAVSLTGVPFFGSWDSTLSNVTWTEPTGDVTSCGAYYPAFTATADGALWYVRCDGSVVRHPSTGPDIVVPATLSSDRSYQRPHPSPDNSVWFVVQGVVLRIAADGTQRTFAAPTDGSPNLSSWGFGVGSSGRAWACQTMYDNSSRLVGFAADGAVRTLALPSTLPCFDLSDVVEAQNGGLWLTYLHEGNLPGGFVVLMAPDGSVGPTIELPEWGPAFQSTTVDSNGTLWVETRYRDLSETLVNAVTQTGELRTWRLPELVPGVAARTELYALRTTSSGVLVGSIGDRLIMIQP